MPCVTAQANAESQNLFLVCNRTLRRFCKCKMLSEVPNKYKNKQYTLVHFHVHLASVQFNTWYKEKRRSLANKIRYSTSINILFYS